MSYIEINIQEKQKYVSIWLTKAEANDVELRENLKPIYEEYKQKKYRVVVFESGRGDLPTLTRDLLKNVLESSVAKDSKTTV